MFHKIKASMPQLILLCLAFYSVLAFPAHAQEERAIQSEIMTQTREIIVHLPKNYDANRGEGYPVIYMLDGGSKDKMIAEVAGYFHWSEIMPEVIVIGLKNVNRGVDFLPDYYDFESDGKQYFGNGGKLLNYIKDELIPYVDTEFNTDGQKAFAGHSWAGQFLTYTLGQSPDLFDAYFITSPAFGTAGRWSEKTFERLDETLKQDIEFPEFIYLSVGGAEDAEHVSGYHRLVAFLGEKLPEKVRLYHEVQDGAVHGSNGAISLPKAMQFYFAKPSVSEES